MSAVGFRHGRAVPYALMCVAVWSLIPGLASSLKDENLDPYQFLFWSNVVSALVLFAVAFARGEAPRFARYSLRQFSALGALGALGSFGYYALLYSAYKDGDRPTVLVAVQYTWPVLTVLFSAMLLRERTTARARTALLLAAAAVALACWSSTSPSPKSILLTGVAALTFALYSAWSKLRRDEPYTSLTIVFASGALLSWALWIAAGAPSNGVSPRGLAFVFLNGAIINGISYAWWLEALKRAPTAFLAPWISMIPVLGLAGLAFLGHPVGRAQWAGVGLILMSIYLTSVAPGHQRAPALVE